MTVPQGERISALEQRIKDHESRCEERLGEIKATAQATQKSVQGLQSRFVMVGIALLAWALAQVYSTIQARPQSPTTTVQVSSQAPAH